MTSEDTHGSERCKLEVYLCLVAGLSSGCIVVWFQTVASEKFGV
jgi:hypothetical protein